MKWLYSIKNLPLLFLFLFAGNEIKQMILKDLYARKNRDKLPPRFLLDLACELESRYFRKLFYFRLNSIGSKIWRIIYGGEQTFIIDINTKIGSGVRLAHPYATILNAKSIGDNLYVNHLVTVGEIEGRRPIIGHNVELHANCTVIGGVIIGDNSIIGAGAVVVKDVPPNTIAVGNPARLIRR